MLKDPLELGLERLLKSLGGSMLRCEWPAPLAAFVCTVLVLNAISTTNRFISTGTNYDKETEKGSIWKSY